MAAADNRVGPLPNEDLVEVFGSEQESAVMVVRGLLESAGLECITRNDDAPQDILPGVGGIAVLVRADQAEEARRIIDEYRNQPATDADEEAAELADAESGTSEAP